MSKILRDLLDAEEPIFSVSLRQLEGQSGDDGVDVRLIGDIAHKMRHSVSALGLDPVESLGREIYAAQLARIRADNDRVTKIIGGNDADDVNHMVPLMVNAVKKMKINRQCWVLKHSVAKKLLREMPPQKLMKHLGYRTIDSMIKHEDIDEIYTALRFSEGSEWLEAYNTLFTSVRPSDFETRDIRILVMDHNKYVGLAESFVKKKLHNITHTKELGVIVVVPMRQQRMKGITLKSLPLLFHYINEIRLYSTFFKLKQVNAEFGKTVVETLNADPGNASQMAGQQVHWRVIQRYFGKLKDESHLEAFEPHVHPEDLHWRHAEEMLTMLDPEMAFWQEKDYVGKLVEDGRPVTFNLMDVSLSYSNQMSYDERYVYHFRESLWNEIFIRYMGRKNLEQQILEQLDNDMIVPSKLKPPVNVKKQRAEELKRKSHVLLRQKMIDSAEGRLQGVGDEFVKAFDILAKYDKTVTVFGSARLSEDTSVYAHAREFASAIVAEGYTVVTGGGFGVMEAANRGAFEVGGSSVGFNINLPTEQKLNAYTTESYEFEHFFSRKVSMTLQTSAYIYFPGGFGTMDELFEIVTLQQTGKIPRVPIVLFSSEFWQPLASFIDTVLASQFKTIEKNDEKLYKITDDIDEAVKIINKGASEQHKQPRGAKPKSRSHK